MIEVRIEHEYFGGACPGLHFRPSPRTGEFLQRAQIVLRSGPEGFVLAATADVPTENPVLRFDAFCTDVGFGYCTRLPASPARLLFRGEGERQQLLPQATDPTLLTEPWGMPPPYFSIEIPLQSMDQRYRVLLPSVSLHWKYLLFGAFARPGLEISEIKPSPADPVRFELSTQTIPGHGIALVSDRPILALAQQTRRFQLIDSASTRVIVKRLPNADIRSLALETLSDGRTVRVAEIYLNP